MELLRLVVFLKGLNEVLLLLLVGRAALWLLAGPGRDTNPVYRGFHVATAPLLRLARRISPSVVSDRHVPFVAFSWLLLLEVLLIAAKVYLVLVRPA